MQVGLRITPFPLLDDSVAFDALRPRRLGVRQFALGDAVGPIPEKLEWGATEISSQGIDHKGGGLSRLHPTYPGLLARLERTKGGGDRARCKLPQLVTPDACPVLDHGEPLALGNFLGDVALAAELAFVGNLQHRIPINRRVVARRIGRGGRRNGNQVEVHPRLAVHLRGIDEAVTAHPDIVLGPRQVGGDWAPRPRSSSYPPVSAHFAGGPAVPPLTHPPASGPLPPRTTPPMSSGPIAT